MITKSGFVLIWSTGLWSERLTRSLSQEPRRLHIFSSLKRPKYLEMPRERTWPKTTAVSWRILVCGFCCTAVSGGARGGSEAHQALLCSFHGCRVSQSVYLQVPGITRLDKSITTMCNLWTLARGFYFPFWREHVVFHCLLYFFLLYCSCAQYPTQIDFTAGTNKQIESRGRLNKGNHCKWSSN